MYKSTGKLVYNPRTHIGSNKNWLVLFCDDNLSNYYRTLYSREYFWKPKLNRPIYGAHISVIRGENIPNINLWGIDANKIVEFEYDAGVMDNGIYYWMKVHCKYLSDLREKYMLVPEPRFGFHITIGLISNN